MGSGSGIGLLAFCLRSLLREYGWQFVRRVAAPHPARTAQALAAACRLDCSSSPVAVSGGASGRSLGGGRSLVGVGFCLKPLNPPCPSGRFNHDCKWLETLPGAGGGEVPEACRRCTIRETGLLALQAGSAFYVMTSARDILLDLFVPALEEGRFTSGLFVLCRYSFRPFAAGLLASGIRGWMFPFQSGDCADYQTWLGADRGVKDEQTAESEESRAAVRLLLGRAAQEREPAKRFQRRGNLLCPG